MANRGVVCHVDKATGTAASATTNAIDTTRANLIVVAVSLFSNKFGGTPASCMSDSKSNTWQLAVGPAGGKAAIFYAENAITDANHTFTFTPTSSEFIAMGVVGIAGALTSGALSNTNSGTGGSDPRLSGSISAVTDEIMVGAASAGGGAAATINGSTWFPIQLQPDGGTEGQVMGFTLAASGESFQFSGTSGSGFNEGAVIAGFKLQASGGGGGTVSYIG